MVVPITPTVIVLNPPSQEAVRGAKKVIAEVRQGRIRDRVEVDAARKVLLSSVFNGFSAVDIEATNAVAQTDPLMTTPKPILSWYSPRKWLTPRFSFRPTPVRLPFSSSVLGQQEVVRTQNTNPFAVSTPKPVDQKGSLMGSLRSESKYVLS